MGLREADRPQRGYIIKLSQSLAFEWGWDVVLIDPTVDLWVSGVRQSSDGGYIVTVKGQFFNRYPTEPFFGLVKLSAAGTLAWPRRIVATVQTEVFDVLQVGNRYVIYGGIYLKDTSNWDLYVGVVNDPDHGDSIDWQVWIGGLQFDGAYTVEPVIYPNASNLVQLDSNWIGLAAYTKSYGSNAPLDISESPLTVFFGDVLVGLAPTQTITVQNVGNSDLHLGTIGSPCAPFDRTGGTCTNGRTLATGGSCTIAISFTPQARGVFSSDFAIASDDPDEGTVSVNLSGKGVEPDIAVTPPSIHFGDVFVGSHVDQIITVVNSGDSDLHLGPIGSPTAPFSKVGGTCEEGLSLGHDESCTIELAFTPTTVGSFSSRIDIASNDPDDPLKQVPLIGNGTGIPEISTDPPVGPGVELDFGKVLVGEISSKIFTIENVGTGELVLVPFEIVP